ncbi:uncharacterized protein LOC126390105 isoform X1 [Epinephelus moara]|uniref:uncharacterized protein LOC126390105 isoform X1 n=1 Tax=Epinephelus moara TaxID=300413 RepID=UPI00214F1AD3|nr:uncharacterized protein LOC126390105 isoform X1 [Epinephelus moara]
MNAEQDSRDKLDMFEPDVKTKEEIILKEEDESPEDNTTDISRHAMVSDLELDELEDSRSGISKVTKKQTTWAVNCFIGWLEAQRLQVDLTTVEKAELNGVLRHFYGSVRNSKGELYGIASYIALRAGLNRFFKEPPVCRSVCLMRDVEFTSANKVFLGVLKKIRKSGRDITSHHPALSPDDIRILRHSRVMDTSTPRGLLNKVWFDIQVYFGRRGKQANRNLKPDSFVIRKKERGLRYCTLSFGDEKERCSMLEKPGSEFCPITSLLKYLRKLPSNATALYLQPKKDLTDEMWYSQVPLGVNYLGSMLSRMCKEAHTSIIYTNHCIRSTPFHQLCDAGLEGREVFPVSMHRSESALQSHQAPSLGSQKLRSDILPENDSAGPAGLDLNHEEFFEDFPFLQTASNQNYIPDAVLPPGEPWLHGGPSRAVLSLPSCLCLCADIGSGISGHGSSGEEQMKVYAKCQLQKGVMFGPYLGEMCRGQMPTNLKYSWAIRDDAAFVYVDASDENKSNWMRYVTYTNSEEEHNLVIFQFYRHIYYRVSQPIPEGAELRVWIGRDYATLLGLGMGDNVKCEFGDKETVLRLLQDIQLVTLPEPSSSSLWSDHSQSQSPMPVISDVTTVSNPDADSGMISGSTFPSPSLISFPSPSSHPMEKYDFMPGTEKLLSHPNATQNSPWYFFGFEPDPTGRPLDRSTLVCKLCGEHVSCGGAADLQNHLTNKHHIRIRDGNKDRSLLTIDPPLVGDDGETTELENPPASLRSPVWEYFAFPVSYVNNKRVVDRKTTVCRLCYTQIPYATSGNTTNMAGHIRRHHKQIDLTGKRPTDTGIWWPLTGQQRSQPVMVNSGLVSTLPMILSSHVTDAITNFLIMDLQPPALVEGHGFKHLIQTLLPSHKELPSPSQLENLLKEHHTRGKMSLAQLLRRKVGSSENEEISDHTAPLEFEPRRRGRPPSHLKEVPHFVTLSVDVWFHNWQGNTERYLTLWAHYIDCNFRFQNVALATQRLMESGVKDYSLRAMEAQVKVMAQEWGISQPNLVLLGGEGRNKMRLGPIRSEKGGEAAGSVPHPNSTTFLEREDCLSPEEPHGLEHGHTSEGPPSVPCFFSAVQGCIEEVMLHSVIFKTLSQFQGILTTLFLPTAQNKGSYHHHAHSLLQTLTKQEQAELKSWAHSCPTWNKLYPQLSILIKYKSLFCELIKEIKGEGLSKEDITSESSSSGSCHANSTSNASSASVTTLRSEWKVLEELCLVLKPLDVACRTLAKEAFPRLSLIKPILTGLLSRHLMTRPGDSSSIMKEVKRMMRRKLASCYDNPVVNRALSVACSLDPQFHGLGFMEDKEQTATFDWLKKEAVRIVKEDTRRSQAKKQGQNKRSPSPGSPDSDSEFLRRSKRLKESRPINFREIECEDDDEESDAGDADESDVADPGAQGGLSGMEFLLGDLFCSAPKSRQSSVEESIDMEMSVFRADKGASLGVEPLQWWRTKAVQFPLLATVARAYLAAPAVAGSAAQDFVQEGAGTTHRKRANIPPESLDSILFLHHNHMSTTESGQTTVRNDEKNSGIEKVP